MKNIIALLIAMAFTGCASIGFGTKSTTNINNGTINNIDNSTTIIINKDGKKQTSSIDYYDYDSEPEYYLDDDIHKRLGYHVTLTGMMGTSFNNKNTAFAVNFNLGVEVYAKNRRNTISVGLLSAIGYQGLDIATGYELSYNMCSAEFGMKFAAGTEEYKGYLMPIMSMFIMGKPAYDYEHYSSGDMGNVRDYIFGAELGVSKTYSNQQIGDIFIRVMQSPISSGDNHLTDLGGTFQVGYRHNF
jgi:hypothetical protein